MLFELTKSQGIKVNLELLGNATRMCIASLDTIVANHTSSATIPYTTCPMLPVLKPILKGALPTRDPRYSRQGTEPPAAPSPPLLRSLPRRLHRSRNRGSLSGE